VRALRPWQSRRRRRSSRSRRRRRRRRSSSSRRNFIKECRIAVLSCVRK
jgi:hypothetical protein